MYASYGNPHGAYEEFHKNYKTLNGLYNELAGNYAELHSNYERLQKAYEQCGQHNSNLHVLYETLRSYTDGLIAKVTSEKKGD